jgi:hypothetical protein
MTSQSGSWSPHPADAEKRFDEDAARLILRRAAEEQTRLEGEEGHSYTLAQLQQIATEAGISPEAVRAAALEHEASRALATSEPGDGAKGGWIATLERRLPASWPPGLRHAVLVAVGVGLFGLLVSVVGVAPVAFVLSILALIALLLLVVGLGPF